jgi:hypothetical protein
MIIAVIVVGVFWPSLGVHLIDGKLALGLLIMSIAWTMGVARRTRWHWPTRRSAEPSEDPPASSEQASGNDGTTEETDSEASDIFIGDEEQEQGGEDDE